MKNKIKKNFFSKVFNFLIKKYLSFPTLYFVMRSKNNFVKNLYINFWVSIAKRKKHFYKFFFEEKNIDIYDNISFDIKEKIENININCLEILERNGILIIENALSKENQNQIIEQFNKINIKDNRNLIKNDTVIKYFEESDLDNFKDLRKLSDYFTDKIYGKPLKSFAEFYIHSSLKIPEITVNGDNNLHVDRFLPNMKLYYSPFNISENDAPFCYSLGSHKINNQYLKFVKNSKLFSEAEIESKPFIKNSREITCKANSLVIALTNGFHGRKPFLKKTIRKLVFLQYHKSFNKISLLLN
tara:strand:+ start:20364 stop:21263 length:900 start_codon:yes stop_codon:yes gene_type:complete